MPGYLRRVAEAGARSWRQPGGLRRNASPAMLPAVVSLPTVKVAPRPLDVGLATGSVGPARAEAPRERAGSRPARPVDPPEARAGAARSTTPPEEHAAPAPAEDRLPPPAAAPDDSRRPARRAQAAARARANERARPAPVEPSPVLERAQRRRPLVEDGHLPPEPLVAPQLAPAERRQPPRAPVEEGRRVTVEAPAGEAHVGEPRAGEPPGRGRRLPQEAGAVASRPPAKPPPAPDARRAAVSPPVPKGVIEPPAPLALAVAPPGRATRRGARLEIGRVEVVVVNQPAARPSIRPAPEPARVTQQPVELVRFGLRP